jgi:hypothetical protein
MINYCSIFKIRHDKEKHVIYGILGVSIEQKNQCKMVVYKVFIVYTFCYILSTWSVNAYTDCLYCQWCSINHTIIPW